MQQVTSRAWELDPFVYINLPIPVFRPATAEGAPNADSVVQSRWINSILLGLPNHDFMKRVSPGAGECGKPELPVLAQREPGLNGLAAVIDGRLPQTSE